MPGVPRTYVHIKLVMRLRFDLGFRQTLSKGSGLVSDTSFVTLMRPRF